jgi:DNA polymerase-3 subunit delta'
MDFFLQFALRMQFREIIGQEKAKKAFLGLAKENRVPHALILKGQEGIGKLAFANAIAQYINCENPTETDSCGECASCSKVRKGIHPDVRFILPTVKTGDSKDTGSDDFFHLFREKFHAGSPYFSFKDWMVALNGENKQAEIRIHEIRELKRKISLKAFEAKYKVVVIWNAETIRVEAANAMLKVLEEPPDKTVMIMTVSDQTQLLTTINSRCQRLQMHRVKELVMQGWLQKNFQMDEDHAMQVASLADGSVTRAIELVNESDRSISDLYQNWLRICFKGDYEGIQQAVTAITKENKEYQKMFLGFGLQKLRDSLFFSFGLPEYAFATGEERDFQEKFSKYLQFNGIDELSRLMEDSLYYVSRNANSQLVFSVLSLRIHSLLTGKVLI